MISRLFWRGKPQKMPCTTRGDIRFEMLPKSFCVSGPFLALLDADRTVSGVSLVSDS